MIQTFQKNRIFVFFIHTSDNIVFTNFPGAKFLLWGREFKSSLTVLTTESCSIKTKIAEHPKSGKKKASLWLFTSRLSPPTESSWLAKDVFRSSWVSCNTPSTPYLGGWSEKKFMISLTPPFQDQIEGMK